ncbi:MAG: elongation factor G [Deltaproteobacteria bacterium]|nr:elongation factor G [Deltaproteobacteria bacterium]MBW2445065.1 elongation factor G [Deltaproteobacteria bacterium]
MTDVADIRNFALVGHAHDGKTSVGEALLHAAGATPELGKVDDGTSHLDTLPEEKDGHNRHTVSSSIFAFEHDGKALTLVDTPGDPNFQADGQIALRGLDGAVVVVSAVDGAKVGTDRMAREAKESGAACIAFINGMDRERADFDAAIESLAKLGLNPVPLALPVGAGEGLKGVVDLLEMKDVPAEMKDAADAARQQLVESAAECDDELLEKYLEEGEISEEEALRGLITGVHAGQVLPVLCGAANREIGIAPLLRAIGQLLPSPADRGAWSAQPMEGEGELELSPEASAPLSALVLKTCIDRYSGTLSMVRVVSGTLKGDGQILDATTGERVRVGKLLKPAGAEHSEISEARPGQIVALAKLKDVHTGHSLTAEKGGARLPELPIPEGVLSYAISAKTKGDEDKVHASLGRLVEEDPALRLGREASTGEFLLTGMGELHIRTTVQKLKRLFDVEVELKTPKVPYRETVTRKAEHIEGKLKKQTGGKGMFGVCFLTVEPMERGSGFEFADEIVGGSIPRSLIPAVEKGVLEAMERGGPLAGYPVVDIRVRCTDGKHHSVDSNEMAFKLAGSSGFRAAVEAARPTLLEPIMNLEVTAPDDAVGDVMGDLSSRRGRVQSSEARGNATVIQAIVPMSEILEYQSTLTSITGGQGAFHMEFSHYDEAPAQVRDRVVEETRKEREAEPS